MLAFDRFAVRLSGRTLAALTAEVEPGEVLSVMGPSGAGKSSLLLGAAGLLRAPFAVAGRVLVDGQDVTDRPPDARRIGLMLQDACLFPHMSVLGNVLFAVPRRADGRRLSAVQRRQRALEHLGRVAMADCSGRDPDTLSGGQKSRVALARALASSPRALFLDEPFAALDQDLRQQTRAMVFDLARADALAVVLVSHDPADATAAGGRVLTLRGCQDPPAR